MAGNLKRLAFLEQHTSSGDADTFAWYGLAMEYRACERWDQALKTFEKLRVDQADYVAQYLMCGQMLAGLNRKDDAKEWLDAGVEIATQVSNEHALGELRDALEQLDD